MATPTVTNKTKPGKQVPPPVETKKVGGYTSRSTGSSVTVIEEVLVKDCKALGLTFGQIRMTKPKDPMVVPKPYTWMKLSEELLKVYDLGTDENGEPNDSVPVYFTQGAKSILQETGGRLSGANMTLVEILTTEDDENGNEEEVTKFVIKRTGDDLGGGEAEIV